MAYILFITFVVLVPILFSNLLVSSYTEYQPALGASPEACNMLYMCTWDNCYNIQIGLAVGTTEEDAESATLMNIKLRVRITASIHFTFFLCAKFTYQFFKVVLYNITTVQVNYIVGLETFCTLRRWSAPPKQEKEKVGRCNKHVRDRRVHLDTLLTTFVYTFLCSPYGSEC